MPGAGRAGVLRQERRGGLEHVEEEGAPIGGRAEVEALVMGGRVERGVRGRRDDPLELGRGGVAPRRQRELEAVVVVQPLHAAAVLLGERRRRHQQRGHALAGDQDETRARLLDADVEQRRDGERHQAGGLRDVGRVEPARHAEDAGRRERPEKHAPAFPRIEAVLGQREGPGAGRRPGVDQRHLQDVEALRGPRQVRARFVVHERHARDRWRRGRSRDSDPRARRRAPC